MASPGEYVPDVTEGITRVEDLPSPHLEHRRRNYLRRRCPRCGRSAGRCGVAQRTLHDMGNPRSGRPLDLVVTYSKHRCSRCRRCFNADMADLALPKCHYTHRVQHTAVRSVVEDGLPYRSASWHLWRDHRVLVPWATIARPVGTCGETTGSLSPGTCPQELGTPCAKRPASKPSPNGNSLWKRRWAVSRSRFTASPRSFR